MGAAATVKQCPRAAPPLSTTTLVANRKLLQTFASCPKILSVTTRATELIAIGQSQSYRSLLLIKVGSASLRRVRPVFPVSGSTFGLLRSEEDALHPSFCNQGPGDIAVWNGSACLRLGVIPQKFLLVQNTCLGNTAVVECAPYQTVEIVFQPALLGGQESLFVSAPSNGVGQLGKSLPKHLFRPAISHFPVRWEIQHELHHRVSKKREPHLE